MFSVRSGNTPYEQTKLMTCEVVAFMNNTPPKIKKQNGLWIQIKEFILRGNLHRLVYYPVVIGFLLMVTTIILVSEVTNSRISASYRLLSIFIMLWVSSLGGIVAIVRREFPWNNQITIQGKWAVILGIAWLVFCIVTPIVVFCLVLLGV